MQGEATMTLADYANSHEYSVLHISFIGMPVFDIVPLGHPDMDFAERRGLLDLEGEVDATDVWRWNGQGNPTLDRGSSITEAHAFIDVERWKTLEADYNAETTT